MVGDALRRIAGLSLDDPEIVASDDAWRYRSKITLTARTTKQGRRVFGLHRYATPGVFEPRDCMITRERVMALWGRVRDHGTFFPRNAESVTLREDREGELHVVFAGGTPPCRSKACLFETQRRKNEVFARFVPSIFLEYLGQEVIEDVRLGHALERRVTVMFSDLREFTALDRDFLRGIGDINQR